MYIPVVLSVRSRPILLVPAALVWVRQTGTPQPDEPGRRIRTLLWLWILVIVGFFSLSVAKQDLYIFPIVPAVVALAGVVIVGGIRSPAEAPGIRFAIASMGTILMAAGAGFYALFHGPSAVYVLGGSALIAASAMLGGGAGVLLAWRRQAATGLRDRPRHRHQLGLKCERPTFEAYKPRTRAAEVLKSRASPDDLIVTYNVAAQPRLYLRRPDSLHTTVVLDLLRGNRPLYPVGDRRRLPNAIEPAASVCCAASRRSQRSNKLATFSPESTAELFC